MYNISQFTESKLDRVRGGFCGILLNHLITTGNYAYNYCTLKIQLFTGLFQ